MAKPLQIEIKESVKELRVLQGKYGELIGKRIRMLLEIKKHQSTGISKRDLSNMTGINHNSIVKWRNMYLNGGIESLLSHGRIGFKPSLLNEEEHEKLKEKLHNPTNGLQGYKELQQWVKECLGKEMKYTTLYEYAKRHFGTKIKTARKSHLKKNEEEVLTFKKTLGKSV